MRIVVHAGLHKTGTTSFQTRAYHSTQALMSKGVYYPPPINRAGIIGQHSEVALLLMDGERQRVSNYLEQVSSDAERCRWNTVLMSGEEFSSLSEDPETFDFLAGELRRLFGEWEFVIAVRSLAPHTASQIMQDVFDSRLTLTNRAFLRTAALERMYRTVNQVVFFAARTDSRLIDYANLTGSGNLCQALLDGLVGHPTIAVEDLRDNTFEGKITTAANFALASLRGAIAVAFPDETASRLAEVVDVDRLNAAFDQDALSRLADGLKAGVSVVSAKAVDDSLAKIRAMLGPHQDALRMLGAAPSSQSETGPILSEPQSAEPVTSTM